MFLFRSQCTVLIWLPYLSENHTRSFSKVTLWRLGWSVSFGLILSLKKLFISFLAWLDVDILPCIVENNRVYNITAGLDILLTVHLSITLNKQNIYTDIKTSRVPSQRPHNKDVCRGGGYHRLHVQFRPPDDGPVRPETCRGKRIADIVRRRKNSVSSWK